MDYISHLSMFGNVTFCTG